MKQHQKKYLTVALGGTFDHFHEGHKAFIDAAAGMGQRLLIGITSKKLLHSKQYPHTIESIKTRFRSVGSYCKRKGYTCELVEIFDTYGPTVDPDVKIDALFVTTETLEGANKISEVRDRLRLKKLPVHIFDLVLAEDGKPIHAERIRAGEMSREGVVYERLFASDRNLTPVQKAELPSCRVC